ncbi:Helitron helicase [Phytophthora megakarya]|uniref:ATP-dependent DNA helicase n=1 Tax=Phytophthora megakarya TaxID=4795 RepID=A0A225V8M1_9STRA|nr:Helitron helicase [Phytophthora megakarya]
MGSPEVGQTLFFVHGPGGTGTSFLLEQLLAKFRLEVASRGIAATLLTGGRAVRSMFLIPLTPTEYSTCGILQTDSKGEFNSTSPINYLG